MIEFDKITTRGGDRGESSLYNGERHRKDEIYFEAMGDMDELNSWLGLVKAYALAEKVKKAAECIENIELLQKYILKICSLVATPYKDPLFEKIQKIGKNDVEIIEEIEKKYINVTELPDVFILPGGNKVSAALDLARSVCRRCERKIITCIRDHNMPHLTVSQNLLNRASDLLFVMGRYYGNSK